MAEKRYTIDRRDGWFNIRSEPSGQIIAVPEFLQVGLSFYKDSRDYFTVLEGVEKNKAFSVKIGNLKSGNPG